MPEARDIAPCICSAHQHHEDCGETCSCGRFLVVDAPAPGRFFTNEELRRYGVDLCEKCVHPGGQHRMAHGDKPAGCVLCDCDGWEDDKSAPGWWSTAHQILAEEVRDAS